MKAGSTHPELFDAATAEVYRLMERDTYRRFLKADGFLQLRLAVGGGRLLPSPADADAPAAAADGVAAQPVLLDDRCEIEVDKSQIRWQRQFAREVPFRKTPTVPALTPAPLPPSLV